MAGCVFEKYGKEVEKAKRKNHCKACGVDIRRLVFVEIVTFWRLFCILDIDKSITKVCITASEIMLGHLQMGQATATLSGGENIRIKIMKASKSIAKVIGVDEPFKGLSNIEIDAVANYLNRIREKERTLIVIDHSTSIEDYFSEWIQIENVNNILSGRRLK